MKQIVHVFFHWLPLGAGMVLAFGFAYGIAQQDYRQSLNDPQIQIVRDAEQALLSGKQPSDVAGASGLFDVEKSLAPFVAVYDANGTILESSGSIGNVAPNPPAGIFQYTKTHGEDRVTWQPNSTTRIALVVHSVNVGSGLFVVSGRNMSEIESRISNLGKMTALALLLALLVTFGLDFIAEEGRRKVLSQIQDN